MPYKYKSFDEYHPYEKLNAIYKYYTSDYKIESYSDLITLGLRDYNTYIHTVFYHDDDADTENIINNLLRDENDTANIIIALNMCVEIHKKFFKI